jgi:ribA/ribD-fused uncharacterized protein
MNAKSAEHAFQYSCAIRAGDSEMGKKIIEALTAIAAKKLSKILHYSPDWETDKVNVMKEIMVQKSKQIEGFNDALIESKNTTLAEAVPNEYFWSNGLPKDDLQYTRKRFWPGKNTMDNLLIDLRNALLKKT